ncbi:MAG: DNA methyltransferase [candidate division Zixibacteria bacterium]|nr:DNA methyltransferase [candidate division Zixibacteria bacterium]
MARRRSTAQPDSSSATLLQERPTTPNVPQVLTNGDCNKLFEGDRAGHDWYRFVLSYPPHLVREYLTAFGLGGRQRVLDPFCGTGTTLVECKKLGIDSVGLEANPMAHFASSVKVDWSPEPGRLVRIAERIAGEVLTLLGQEGISDDPLPLFAKNHPPDATLRSLPEAANRLLLANSISPLPLHKTLVLLERIKKTGPAECRRHYLLALAKTMVFTSSNLRFGPEVGLGKVKTDAAVVHPWLEGVRGIARDLESLRNSSTAESSVLMADSRSASSALEKESIDAVITSPPYPNEKDYTRTTRLESVILGFINDKEELRALKRNLVRSNTRGVYKGDDDDNWVSSHLEIQGIAEEIETRRLLLGKTSGFERLYGRVAKLYFGGMARHLADLRGVLRPGARLAYVVGDQASYLRVMIRTGEILGRIAQSLGYELVAIDLFRTRLATATREQLREEVVVLRWPGQPRKA